MAKNTPRKIKYGNDFFCEINKNSSLPLKITYWDLWISIILVEFSDSLLAAHPTGGLLHSARNDYALDIDIDRLHFPCTKVA